MGRKKYILALLLLLLPSAVAAEWPGPDEAEQELLRLLRSEKYIRAREKAEKLLRKRPGSIIAGYTMAMVYHDEEANLPRALYHIRRTEQRLVKRFGDRPTDHQAKVWHRKILVEQSIILGEMDLRTEQLEVMDRADARYTPKMDRWRIWPLMKLHRFDEALKLSRKLALSEDQYLRITGLNGLIAVDSERLRPRPCFKAGLKAVTATSHRSCILNQNTAEAAFAVYRFSEAERLALKSVQAPIEDCPASAYPHLANLYLLRADFQKAMDAVKSSRGAKVEKRYRQQFEMSNTAWLSRLLYTLGKFHKAHELAGRIMVSPDRVGMTSFSREVMKVIYTLDYHAAIMAKAEALREQASARPLSKRPVLWARLADLHRAAWVARRRVARLLSSKDHLLHLLRPYLKPLPPWHAGELIEVVGSGVMLRALARVRAAETMKEETAPYFDALEAEVAFRGGRMSRALTLALSAVKGLPRDEVLLRGRTRAIAAAAAWKLGQHKEAEVHFRAVLHRFPTALRILGVRLPVTIRTGPKELAGVVGKRLLSSRRLTAGQLGFTVRVTGDRKALRICLERRGGQRVACSLSTGEGAKADEAARAWREAGKDRAALVALALDRFHEKVFAPKIDLTQRDINSLDGSAVRGDADEVLRGVLGDKK